MVAQAAPASQAAYSMVAVAAEEQVGVEYSMAAVAAALAAMVDIIAAVVVR